MSATPPPSRRRRRLRWSTLLPLLFLLTLVVAVAATVVARQQLLPTQPVEQQLEEQQVAVERGDLLESVAVNGVLSPRDQARIRLPEGQRLRELLVARGDTVAAGDLLARFETRDLELKLVVARADLDQAQQALDKLLAGPSEAELADAAAAVAQARAELAVDAQGVREIDRTLAQARLDAARQRLADLETGVATDDISAAERGLAAAETALEEARLNLERTRDSASRAKTDARQAIDREISSLEKTQRAYSDAFWDWDFVRQTGRHPIEQVPDASGRLENRLLTEREIEGFRRGLIDAEATLRASEQGLANVSAAYDQARVNEVRDVMVAERGITSAERNLAEARRTFEIARTTGLQSAILTAQREVAEAEKAFTELTNTPTRAARRLGLEAALLKAIAAEEKLQAGPDPIEVARARSALEQARAALASAETNLEAASIRAPIAGTIVELALTVGTLTAANDAIRIVDLQNYLIRGQVTEQDVARLRSGQPVQVAVDSLPGETLPGELILVGALPTNLSDPSQSANDPAATAPLAGLYPVEIAVQGGDSRLRVGMAATASIEVLRITDVLFIPLQAVVDGVVRRADGTTVTPELGAISGDRVEVRSGLVEGESILLQLIPPAVGEVMP